MRRAKRLVKTACQASDVFVARCSETAKLRSSVAQAPNQRQSHRVVGKHPLLGGSYMVPYQRRSHLGVQCNKNIPFVPWSFNAIEATWEASILTGALVSDSSLYRLLQITEIHFGVFRSLRVVIQGTWSALGHGCHYKQATRHTYKT